MTYNAGIPNSGDLLSTSQGQMKTNFGQLNTQFGIDHVPFNNGGSNGSGFHKQVTLTAPVAAAPAGTVSILHSVNGANFFSGKPIAYFANSVGDYPLMPDLKTSGTQNAFKLANVIINYGYATLGTSSGVVTFNFVAGFTYTSATSYVLTYSAKVTNATTIFMNQTTGSQFTLENTSSVSTITVNFFAIGT